MYAIGILMVVETPLPSPRVMIRRRRHVSFQRALQCVDGRQRPSFLIGAIHFHVFPITPLFARHFSFGRSPLPLPRNPDKKRNIRDRKSEWYLPD